MTVMKVSVVVSFLLCQVPAYLVYSVKGL